MSVSQLMEIRLALHIAQMSPISDIVIGVSAEKGNIKKQG